MLLREFLTLHVAPLQALLCLLVGGNQEYPPSVFVPLFRRSDWEQIVASRATFDGRGLVPPVRTGAPAAPKHVELSSDESHGEEEGEEEDSAVTPEGMRETAPLSKADILRALPDDAEADARPLPSAKKSKEDAAATPPSAKKGGDSTRTSPARSPSRDQEVRRHEESAPDVPLAPEVPMFGSAAEVPKAQEPLVSQALVTVSPPSPAAPSFPGSSASSTVLERALSEMTRLREDLLGEDPRLAATVSEAALKDAKAAHERCRALEDELKGLRDEHVEEAHGRRVKEEEMRAREDAIKNRNAELAKTQAAEHGRLEELERKVEVKKVDLDAKAKILAEDRAAFALLEKRSREALKTRLDELLETVADEHCTATAAAVKGQVEALLKKFRGFASAPSTGSAATPAAPAGDQDEGDIIKGVVPLAGVDGVQG
nr:protein bangles and beads-like [Aegilops tauschii subsp. strangulata]